MQLVFYIISLVVDYLFFTFRLGDDNKMPSLPFVITISRQLEAEGHKTSLMDKIGLMPNSIISRLTLV